MQDGSVYIKFNYMQSNVINQSLAEQLYFSATSLYHGRGAPIFGGQGVSSATPMFPNEETEAEKV